MIRRLIIPILLLAAGFAAGYFTQSRPISYPAGPLTFDAIDQRRLARAELHETTFGGAVKYVHEVTGIDIAAQWPHDSARINYQTPFDPDLSLRDVTVGQFLDRLNTAVDQSRGLMRIDMHDGFLIVKPDGYPQTDFSDVDADADWRNVTTCVYNVESLITQDGPWERLAVPRHDTPIELPMNMIGREDLLQHTVFELIARDSWKDRGGMTGSQRMMNGRLIVTQTPPAQRAIYEVIKTLREAK